MHPRHSTTWPWITRTVPPTSFPFRAPTSRHRRVLWAALLLGLCLAARAQDIFANGLVAHYPFNGNANDESGHGHHGIIEGATFAMDRFDAASAAIQFDADQITTSWFPPLGTASRTVSGWFRVLSPADMTLMAYGGGVADTGGRFEVRLLSTGELCLDFSNGFLFTAGNFADAQWHHFAAVAPANCTAADIRLYVDSVVQTCTVSDPWVRINTLRGNPLQFGRLYVDWDSRDFTGFLDDVRIYERALSAAEVEALYDFELHRDFLVFSDPARLTENTGTATLHVLRLPQPDSLLYADYGVTGGSATWWTDYQFSIWGQLEFPPGITNLTLPLSILDDAWVEGEEFFTLDITNCITGNRYRFTFTIHDDDTGIEFEDAARVADEATEPLVLGVRRQDDSPETATVEFTTVDGTAHAGEDYMPTDGTLTFTSGETHKVITITLLEDAIREMEEHFTVRLFHATGGSSLGAVTEVTVTIPMNDLHTLHVWKDSPSPTPPYVSWATAAHAIQDAVAAALPNDTVLVASGVYRAGTVETNGLNRVAVTNAITVRSVNGPELTVIEGSQPNLQTGEGSSVRCAFVGNGAVLSGFTLTKGGASGDAWPKANGGGAWCEPAGMLTNCVLSDNSALDQGGGVFGGTLDNCMLTGNSAEYGGGAGSSILNHCTFTSNGAYAGGGASGGTLSHCTLTSNSAQSKGGGVVGGTLHNSVLARNQAESGGAAAGGFDGGCTLHNCTLVDNTASTAGGGAAGGGRFAACSLYNCIVYGNRGGNYSGNAALEHCCTTPLPPGAGNIDADPLLITASHIAPHSPCAGAGNAAYAGETDIDGDPWANPPAIGADQPVADALTGPLAVWIDAVHTTVAADYPISFTAWNTGPIQESVWDFGDGTTLTNQALASHAWKTPGLYTVRLTGYNQSYPTGVKTSIGVLVSDAVHYVDPSCPNPTFPFNSWATAATTIQEAIGASTIPGRRVLVTDGVYRLGTTAAAGQNRIALTNLVTVQSLHGPRVTIVEGDTNGLRCAYVGNDAVLSGFTLTQGTAIGDWESPASSGGGVRCEPFAVVTNCVLTGNSAQSSGGGAYGGNLLNCLLTDNSAGAGGGACRATLFNCVVTDNRAAYGGGVETSTLYHCTLADNSADCCSGASSAKLFSCIVRFNGAPPEANYGGETTFEYSCTTPLPEGPGNHDAEPLFVDATNGDYQLRPDSPCIDSGDPLSSLTTDLLGLPRPLANSADGIARVDMGAFEFNPYRFEPVLSVTPQGILFTVRGEPGKTLRIERSRDLVNWQHAATVPIPAAGQTLIDPAAITEPFLFYRAVADP